MRKSVYFIIIYVAALVTCWADSLRVPFAYIAVADSRMFYFKMVPDPEQMWNFDSAGSGTVYQIGEDGTERLVWSVSGWYAYSTYLSHDGEYLVRMGNWPAGSEPSDDHLAVAFYKHGQLIKRYSTKDLVQDATKVKRSVSHYTYLSKVYGFEYYTHSFSLASIDGILYTFDVSTGDILLRIDTTSGAVDASIAGGEKIVDSPDMPAKRRPATDLVFLLIPFVIGGVLGAVATYITLRLKRRDSA